MLSYSGAAKPCGGPRQSCRRQRPAFFMPGPPPAVAERATNNIGGILHMEETYSEVSMLDVAL